jgi:hypothetical protein
VVESINQRKDGSRVMAVAKGVVRSDGGRPTELEATALAVLALDGHEGSKTWWADLGASLLAGYRPARGWGDGRANLVCLRAVQALFSDPIPEKVRIVLSMDGQTLAQGELSGRKVRDVLSLSAPVPKVRGRHIYRVIADPPLPGLGFRLTLQSWEPWEARPPKAGLELKIEVPDGLRAGQATGLVLTALAPAGMALEIRHALPAGVQPDPTSLQALVSAGTISGFNVEEGLVLFEVPVRQPGKVFQARYRVVPTFAGTLLSSASTIAPSYRPDRAFVVPPTAWKIR